MEREIRINVMDISALVEDTMTNDIGSVLYSLRSMAKEDSKAKQLEIPHVGNTFLFNQEEKIIRTLYSIELGSHRNLLELTYRYKGKK